MSDVSLVNADGVTVFQGTMNGGSQTVKTETVGIDYTDIDIATGRADLYLLPENETLLCVCPIICTEAFNGTNSDASEFTSVQCYGPGGVAADKGISDTFDLTGTNESRDGLLAAAPTDVTFVTSFFSGATPVAGDGPVQLTMDVTSGNPGPLDSIGTQGHVDISLVLLVRS